MAHLVIEYSAGMEERCRTGALCGAVYGAMKNCGIFPLAGIRVRAHRANYAIVADGKAGNDFIHMTLSVGAGRTTEALKDAGQMVFDAARSVLGEPLASQYFALSLEIRVIDPELSWKDNPIHARLAGQS